MSKLITLIKTTPRTTLLLLGTSIAFLILLGFTGFLVWQNYQLTSATREVEKVTQQVKKLMELPDETPTLATVTEKEKLQSQVFFKKSENGDKVLIYPGAKKAILYRPSSHKIIEVSPFITTDTPTETSSAPTTTLTTNNEQVSTTLLNGSTTVGITNTIDDKLKAKFPTLAISQKAPAKRTDYPKALVIDISGKNQALAEQIAQTLGGEVSTLPAGEDKPSTDLVVIIGQASI